MILQIPASDDVKQKNIMVIDNDVDMTHLLNVILGMEGYDIIIAADEDEALGLMNKVKPDMVIMDTAITNQDNLRTISSLREHSDVPIIILSSDTESETIRDVLSSGADDFVIKPFAVQVLRARIRAKLRRRYQFRKELHFPR